MKEKIVYEFLKLVIPPIFKTFYKIEVKGLENFPQGSVILASNHTSFLDPLIIGIASPRYIYWLVGKFVYEVKYLKWFFMLCSCIPVDTQKTDIKALKKALRVVKENKVLGIFPEGGRSEDGRLQKIKGGVSLLALKSQAPVLPVAIKGAFEAYPLGRIVPKLFKSISVHFGTPLRFDEVMRDGRLNEKVLDGVSLKIMCKIKELLEEKIE